ncbi:hypothetical protein [Rhodophyticola sp.]|jgi:hypothetical protein|uniref:hypothetical protein n=1 Tax=Rhodophyticola sp. TaxID=2680032 RepID=UPI001B0117C3|nr:hypothetical protein [Roseicyclus sp.]MBO6623531.1 hypothetical protein [Roseicyclus sp.]MBO6923804.1 hypothetical protein [Roseicyclus sp.]
MTPQTLPYTGYDGLAYDRDELARVMRATYDEIIDFVTTPEFKALMTEMSALSPVERPRFVFDVLLNDEALASRGIVAPEGLLIQRSAFGDRRPTLFVVKKFLPEEYKNVWQNVNITFDNAFVDESVGRDPETSWRVPLPADVQAAAMARGKELETV